MNIPITILIRFNRKSWLKSLFNSIGNPYQHPYYKFLLRSRLNSIGNPYGNPYYKSLSNSIGNPYEIPYYNPY